MEWLLVDRFKPMRSQAIGGGHREYLDLRKVAATFGQTFAAGSAQSRLDIARLVMRCALIVLKTNRPDASITDTSLHAWADEGSESAILKPSGNRPRPVVQTRSRRVPDSERANALLAGHILSVPGNVFGEPRGQEFIRAHVGAAAPTKCMLTAKWRWTMLKQFSRAELVLKASECAAFTEADPQPALYRHARRSWQLLVFGAEVIEAMLAESEICKLKRGEIVETLDIPELERAVKAFLRSFSAEEKDVLFALLWDFRSEERNCTSWRWFIHVISHVFGMEAWRRTRNRGRPSYNEGRIAVRP